MTTSIWLKAAALWLAILALAIVNGVVRERFLIPALGGFAGLIASGGVLSVAIFFVAFAGAPWYGPLAPAQWLFIGLLWLLLTLVFEFGFGFARHKPLTEILGAYTFRGGNIWPLVLIVTLVAPWLAAKLRNLA